MSVLTNFYQKMSEIDFPVRPSHKSRLVTQENEQSQSSPSSPQRNVKLNDLKLQVENYLDLLEMKVMTVKEKNLGEFLVAYKSYMDKIKRDLQQLKQKSDDMEKYYKENERIQSMEKQLSWFREESVKLYTKVELKNKEIFELKFRIQGMKKENEFLESQIKGLMKKNRQFEVILKTQPDQSHKQLDTTTTNLFCTQTKTKRINSSHLKRESPLAILLGQGRHLSQVQEILRKHIEIEMPQLAEELSLYMENVERNCEKQNRMLKMKLNQTITQATKVSAIRTELEDFFLDCVETIKKDILKRRTVGNSMNEEFLRNNKDYQMFRKEDKQKVLELLLTDEKLIMHLYQKIFPSSLNQQISALNTITIVDPQNGHEEKKRSYSTKDRIITRKGKINYRF